METIQHYLERVFGSPRDSLTEPEKYLAEFAAALKKVRNFAMYRKFSELIEDTGVLIQKFGEDGYETVEHFAEEVPDEVDIEQLREAVAELYERNGFVCYSDISDPDKPLEFENDEEEHTVSVGLVEPRCGTCGTITRANHMLVTSFRREKQLA